VARRICDHTLTGGESQIQLNRLHGHSIHCRTGENPLDLFPIDVIARRARVGTDSRHFPAKEDLYRAIRPLFAPAAIECRQVRRKLAEVTRSDSNTWRRSVRVPRVAA
jgi:hypothetical protein